MNTKFLLAVTLLASCQQAKRMELVSVVSVADPMASPQLLRGFYNLEAKTWRWTGREFAVSLLPPAGAEQKGAKLDLRLFIPEEHIAKLGPMTLKAAIDDFSLQPETYSKGGSFSYIREIPPDILKTNLLPVSFSFDKAFQASGGDGRELGAVVTSIALISH